MAASWDPDAIETAQRIAARESRAVGITWTFAPMVDVARDPRWGRIIEGTGEFENGEDLGGVAPVQVGLLRCEAVVLTTDRASCPAP